MPGATITAGENNLTTAGSLIQYFRLKLFSLHHNIYINIGVVVGQEGVLMKTDLKISRKLYKLLYFLKIIILAVNYYYSTTRVLIEIVVYN